MNKKLIEYRKIKHIQEKEQRLKEIREKVLKQKPQTVRGYLIIANSVCGKKRIESRKRVNKIICEKINEKENTKGLVLKKCIKQSKIAK